MLKKGGKFKSGGARGNMNKNVWAWFKISKLGAILKKGGK